MSRIETHTVSITVRVYDTAALVAAAIKHAMTVDGMTEDEARETLADLGEDDGIDVGACLQMLLDPGVSPDGCTIEESSANYLYGEDDDSDIEDFAEAVAAEALENGITVTLATRDE